MGKGNVSGGSSGSRYGVSEEREKSLGWVEENHARTHVPDIVGCRVTNPMK